MKHVKMNQDHNPALSNMKHGVSMIEKGHLYQGLRQNGGESMKKTMKTKKKRHY